MTILPVAVFALVLLLPLTFAVRVVGIVLSPAIRCASRKHPLAHFLWLLGAVAAILYIYNLPALSGPPGLKVRFVDVKTGKAVPNVRCTVETNKKGILIHDSGRSVPVRDYVSSSSGVADIPRATFNKNTVLSCECDGYQPVFAQLEGKDIAIISVGTNVVTSTNSRVRDVYEVQLYPTMVE